MLSTYLLIFIPCKRQPQPTAAAITQIILLLVRKSQLENLLSLRRNTFRIESVVIKHLFRSTGDHRRIRQRKIDDSPRAVRTYDLADHGAHAAKRRMLFHCDDRFRVRSRLDDRLIVERFHAVHIENRRGDALFPEKCRRFLRNTNAQGANNTGTLPQTYTFDFILSERRNLGNAEPLAEVMNTFMVEYALAKFYSVVSQGDLSNKHSLLAIDAGKELDVILYTKLPPRV